MTPGRRCRVLLFDYGNTLVPWGRREAAIVDRVLAETTARHVAGADPVALLPAVASVRDGLIRGTQATGREVTGAALARALARAAGAAETPAGLEAELEVRAGEAFVASLRLPPDTLPVLDALAPRYRLGLVSNYYLPRPLHLSLERLGIAPRLSAAVVSGEIGWVKPRPEPFREVLRRLGAEPAECIFIGDNVRADVAGASALGMRTVHTREWLADALPADADDQRGDARPDAVIGRLAELPAAVEALERS